MKNNFLWEMDPIKDKSNPLWKDVAKEMWQDMPEYVNEAEECYSRILFKFKTKEDYDQFCKLLNITLNKRTRFTWYPKLKQQINFNKRWINES